MNSKKTNRSYAEQDSRRILLFYLTPSAAARLVMATFSVPDSSRTKSLTLGGFVLGEEFMSALSTCLAAAAARTAPSADMGTCTDIGVEGVERADDETGV